MHLPFSNQSIPVSSVKRGFTLIELLVSVAIITIITSIALFQHSKFNSTIGLTNLAYEVGLSIRQAQVFGIGARQFGGSAQNIAYGVSFNKVSPNSYIIFADINPANNLYNAGGDEAVEGVQITRGNYIQKFCGIQGSASMCSDATGLNELSVLFERPNPDARIYGVVGSSPPRTYDSARIYLANPQGSTRCVLIRPTGQVSVETTCP